MHPPREVCPRRRGREGGCVLYGYDTGALENLPGISRSLKVGESCAQLYELGGRIVVNAY